MTCAYCGDPLPEGRIISCSRECAVQSRQKRASRVAEAEAAGYTYHRPLDVWVPPPRVELTPRDSARKEMEDDPCLLDAYNICARHHITQDQLSMLRRQRGFPRPDPRCAEWSIRKFWKAREIDAFFRGLGSEIGSTLKALRPRQRMSLVFHESWDYIPQPESSSGIYFLMHGKQCVYVGQSTNVRSRVDEHWKAPNKEFTHATVIDVPPERLNEVEGAFIRALRPKHNCNIPAPPEHTRAIQGGYVPELVAEHDLSIIREFVIGPMLEYRVG